MALSFLGYFNGLTALFLVIFGFSMGIYFLYRFFKTKKSLLPLVAVLMFMLGLFYSGPMTSFLALLFGTPIDGILYAYLSYSLMPLTIIVAMILGFDIFKHEWRFHVLWVYIPLAIAFWILFYAFPDISFEYPDITPDELMDISFIGICLIITGFYLLSTLVILAGGFMFLARKIRGTPEFKKTVSLGIGWFFFGLSGILDALLSEKIPFMIAPARALMIAAYILIFIGFRPSRN